MAGPSKTNSFGTFLETIEQEAPAPAPAGAMTEVSRRVLQLLAAGPATVAQIREHAGNDAGDAVMDDLIANGFVERLPGRTVRYGLTAQGQAVVQLLSP